MSFIRGYFICRLSDIGQSVELLLPVKVIQPINSKIKMALRRAQCDWCMKAKVPAATHPVPSMTRALIIHPHSILAYCYSGSQGGGQGLSQHALGKKSGKHPKWATCLRPHICIHLLIFFVKRPWIIINICFTYAILSRFIDFPRRRVLCYLALTC